MRPGHRPYPTGIRYTDKDVAALPLVRNDFHGDWNYSLSLVQDELRIAQPWLSFGNPGS